MKKILTTLAVTAMLAITANADIGRMEMGAGVWQQTPNGGFNNLETGIELSDISNGDDSTAGYAWLLIKHPIPIIPNIRVEYSSLESEGLANGKFSDFDEVTNAATLLEMTQFDVIPYYNILDNTAWVTLDLGLDFKALSVDWRVNDVTGWTSSVYNDTESIVLPLVYMRVRVEIPATDIGIESDVKYITYDDDTVYDVRIKVDYTFDITPVIQSGIELGYRLEKFDISEDVDFGGSKAKIDLEFSGVYAGLMLRF